MGAVLLAIPCIALISHGIAAPWAESIARHWRTPKWFDAALIWLVLGLMSWVWFWVFWLDHHWGRVVLALQAGLTGWWLWRDGRRKRRIHIFLRQILLPAQLSTAVAMLYMSIAAVTYDSSDVVAFMAERFLPHELPIDNRLPLILASQLLDGHIERPMIGDWLASDRPPLQAGFALPWIAWTAERSWRVGLYQAGSVWFQTCWIIGLYTLLSAVGQRGFSLALWCVVISGFALLNTVYVWPKMVGAGYFCMVLALLVRGDGRPPRKAEDA